MPDRSPRTMRSSATWAVALTGVAAVALFALRPDLVGRGPTTDLGPATPAVLDTVSLAGRTVTAHLDGVVEGTAGDTVWLAVRGAAFPVRMRDTAEWRDETRVLVVGRLRSTRGRRWLDGRTWSRVEGTLVAAPDSGRRDTARFVPPADRSAAP